MQFAALAVLAVGVAALHRNRADALVFRPLAAMLVIYVIVTALLNYLLIAALQVPSGSPALVIGALPMLVFLMVRAHPHLMPSAPLSQLPAGAALLAPAVLPVATLAVVLSASRRGDMLAEILGLAAVLLYGWRMVAIQVRHRRSIAELTAAHNTATGLSLIDPLTGLGNRRRFDVALQSMLAASASPPVAILMIDADWFKAFNDNHGHAAGDTALRRIGGALASHSPGGSAVVRLGGEEFAVLARLPDAEAATLAETLRAAVAALQIPHARAPDGYLSISIGVAMTHDGDADAVMAAADTALYAAKDDGRNCVRSA